MSPSVGVGPPDVSVRPVAPSDLAPLVPALVELLKEAVDGGASLGFLAPLDRSEASRYWLSLQAELLAGTRLLVVAEAGGEVVGAGQLVLPAAPNARHRAEIQKVFVSSALRGQGLGKALMSAIHGEAARRDRSLLLLGARRGEPAEAFYRSLGYQEAGIIPGYALDAAGRRHDNVMLYQELPAPGSDVP